MLSSSKGRRRPLHVFFPQARNHNSVKGAPGERAQNAGFGSVVAVQQPQQTVQQADAERDQANEGGHVQPQNGPGQAGRIHDLNHACSIVVVMRI